MDIIKIHEEELKIEEYFEEKKVYEMFKGLMKELVIKRPEDPISFLLSKLDRPKMKWIFIIGPPGTDRKEIALSAADKFSTVCISAGEIINKEVKKGDKGKSIQESKKKY